MMEPHGNQIYSELLHVHNNALSFQPGVHYINYSIVQRTSTQTVSESPVWPFDHIQNILLISLFSLDFLFIKIFFIILAFSLILLTHVLKVCYM